MLERSSVAHVILTVLSSVVPLVSIELVTPTVSEWEIPENWNGSYAVINPLTKLRLKGQVSISDELSDLGSSYRLEYIWTENYVGLNLTDLRIR